MRRFLTSLWRRIVRPHSSVAGFDERRRAQLLMALALFTGLLDLIGLLATLQVGVQAYTYFFLLILLVCLVAYSLGRTRWHSWGALLLSVGISISGFVMLLVGRADPIGALLSTIPLALVLGNILLTFRVQVVLLLLNVLVTFALPVIDPTLPKMMMNGGVFLTLGALLILATAFRDSLERNRLGEVRRANDELKAMQATLEQRVLERTQNAEAARREADTARCEMEAQAWLAAGRAGLSDAMRGDLELSDLANRAVHQICQTLRAQVGALFAWDGERLAWRGGYAWAPPDESRQSLALGDGLAGLSAQEQRLIVLKQVPPGYLDMVSGLGDASPKQIVIIPLVYGGILEGIIEVGMLGECEPRQLEFLKQAGESIALALRTVQAREYVDALLTQTQRQAEDLRAQEEELRAVNEELEAQAENVRSRARERV